MLAATALPLGTVAQTKSTAPAAAQPAGEASEAIKPMPMGKMGNQQFSRLIMGGNLIGGYSHARDLTYVGTLMRHYNTDAKIAETLEVGEAHGVTAINTYVMQENSHIFNHWKRGGKMKWIAQIRLDANVGYSQIRKAIDEGASAVHITGDGAEKLLAQGKFEKVGETVQLIKSQKCVAGVAAHDLRVIVECEKLKLDVDFYQKTFHSHDYYTAPKPGETGPLGVHDNSWCSDPQAVIDFMAGVKKPWIAFKILAAGAIQPRAAFPYAINNGADFILVGMFDWQIAEDAKLAKRVFAVALSSDSKRTRPWFS